VVKRVQQKPVRPGSPDRSSSLNTSVLIVNKSFRDESKSRSRSPSPSKSRSRSDSRRAERVRKEQDAIDKAVMNTKKYVEKRLKEKVQLQEEARKNKAVPLIKGLSEFEPVRRSTHKNDSPKRPSKHSTESDDNSRPSGESWNKFADGGNALIKNGGGESKRAAMIFGVTADDERQSDEYTSR